MYKVADKNYNLFFNNNLSIDLISDFQKNKIPVKEKIYQNRKIEVML